MVHVLSGSASTAVRGLLEGPARSATVIGAGPHAAYLRVVDGGCTRVLAVVVAGAVRVPCAVVLPPGVPLPSSLGVGAGASIGGGSVGWDGGSISATRWWAAARVRSGTLRATAVTSLGSRLAGHELPPGVAAALIDAAHRLADRDGTAAHPLVSVLGLGAGLTPAADDAVAGMLLLARAVDPSPVLDAVGAQIAAAAAVRSTAVSAALLHHAATGDAAPPVVAAVDALTAPGVTGVGAALTALLALGHTSGADTAAGMLALATGPLPSACAA